MRNHVGLVLTVLATLAAPAGVARALDVEVAARKLIISDRWLLAARAKIVYVGLDGRVTKGTGIDPATIGARFEIRWADGTVSGEFVLPPGISNGSDGWKSNDGGVAKYVNRYAPSAGPTDAKIAVIKPGRLLKLVGQSRGDTPIDIVASGAPPPGGVDTIYTVSNGAEEFRLCTHFPQDTCAYRVTGGGTGAKLVCRNGVGSVCPPPPSTTSTTLLGTTSTSSSSSSTTSSSSSSSSSSSTSSSTSTSASTSSSSTTSSSVSTSTSSSTSSSTTTSTSHTTSSTTSTSTTTSSSSTTSSTTSTSTTTSSSSTSSSSSTTSTSTSSSTSTVVPTCTDNNQNGGETDIDCGGPCPDCPLEHHCLVNGDCQSNICIGGTCGCGNQNFTFTVNSNNGGPFDSAEWPGGTATQNGPTGCSATINRPSGNIDLVGTLGNKFSVNTFAGYSACFGTGGEDGDGCQPVSSPPAGIGSCSSTRPSCSAALNGSGSARYFVQCNP